MKYFLDSAKIEEIKYAYKYYAIDGVTTNPRHIQSSGKPFLTVLKELADFVVEENIEGSEVFPISVEINPHLDNHLDMIEEARKISKISRNFVIKIPCNVEGCKAAKLLEDEGIRTNVTLVFSPSQAIQAARINAKFVSPFVGWKEQAGEDTSYYIKDIIDIYRNRYYDTEIIVAALRTPKQVVDATKWGADIVTCGLSVFEEGLNHPYTNYGLNIFTDAWDNTVK